MIVGIVGSSVAGTESYHYDFIEDIIKSLPDDSIIATGDATGVDFMVRLVCHKHNMPCTVIYSKTKDWSGYKVRNEIIAKYADRIISIALPLTSMACYHCHSNTHEKTAGCYTGKLNGNYKVEVIAKPNICERCGLWHPNENCQ